MIAVRHGMAQTGPFLAPAIRTNVDDPDAQPDQAKKRRTGDTRAIGEVPAYGIPTGAGKTGFNSSPRRKTKVRPKTLPNGLNEPPQLSGAPTPSSTPLSVLKLPPRIETPRRPAPVVAPTPAAATLAQIPGAPNPLVPTLQPLEGPAPTKPLPYVLPTRKKPVVEQDAFEQVGIRYGAFLVKPAIEVGGGYDSNPARVPGGKASWFTAIAPEFAMTSLWLRHEFTAIIRGSYTDYASVASQSRPFLDAKFTARIDVHEDTRLDFETRYVLSTDYPGSPDLPAGISRLPLFTDVGGTAGITRRFNRFEVTLKGLVDRVEYEDAKLVNGAVISQKDRDYTQYGTLLRGSYEFTPGIKAFVEITADKRERDLPVDVAGEQRDSDGFSARFGTTFELTRTLTGEVSLGYLTRTYKDPTLPDLHGLLLDASLVWAATGLTTATFTAKTTVDESTLFGVSGVLRHNLAMQVDHAFRRWLIGTLKFSYEKDDYQGSTREDQRFAASALLTYKLSRAWQAKAELREEWLRSNAPGTDYNATIALLGLRWQP